MRALLPFAIFAIALVASANAEDGGAPVRIEVAPGRSLILTCIGAGDQTVFLDAGGSDWSAIWSTLMPRLADHARVCAYDRAGLGESDPARGPRTPFAIVEDMRALIEKAALNRPLILVGHSLGGFNVKLYAALYPDDVAGLVLLDPADDRVWERTRDWARARFGVALAVRSELADRQFIARLVAHYRDCARMAELDGLDPAADAYRRCADPDRAALGPETNARRKRIQATARYQAAQASEIEWSVYGDSRSDGAYAGLYRRGMFGDMPLIVLTHQEGPSDDPLDALSAEQGIELHRQNAALSKRGKQRMVTGAGHYIQLDRPDAVIAAIDEALDAVAKRQ